MTLLGQQVGAGHEVEFFRAIKLGEAVQQMLDLLTSTLYRQLTSFSR
jgi:hypothetical protein